MLLKRTKYIIGKNNLKRSDYINMGIRNKEPYSDSTFLIIKKTKIPAFVAGWRRGSVLDP